MYIMYSGIYLIRTLCTNDISMTGNFLKSKSRFSVQKYLWNEDTSLIIRLLICFFSIMIIIIIYKS